MIITDPQTPAGTEAAPSLERAYRCERQGMSMMPTRCIPSLSMHLRGWARARAHWLQKGGNSIRHRYLTTTCSIKRRRFAGYPEPVFPALRSGYQARACLQTWGRVTNRRPKPPTPPAPGMQPRRHRPTKRNRSQRWRAQSRWRQVPAGNQASAHAAAPAPIRISIGKPAVPAQHGVLVSKLAAPGAAGRSVRSILAISWQPRQKKKKAAIVSVPTGRIHPQPERPPRHLPGCGVFSISAAI